MRKKLQITAIITAALALLCGCETDPGYTPVSSVTREVVTAPTPETIAPIDTIPSVTTGDITTVTGTDSTGETTVTQPADTTRAEETKPEETKPTETEKTDAPAGASASFLFCGDNLVHDAVINNAKRYADGTGQTYNFLPIYDDVADYIKKADCAVINQESQIAGNAGKIGGYPRFNTPEQMGYDLMTLGFDVVTLANNHMLDNKTEGLKNCIDFWKKQPILSVGAYENKSDYDTIRTVNVNGVTVAFLAYTEMTNSDRKAENGYITPLLDEATVKRHVETAKKAADVVIVLPHWGKEDSFDVTGTQKKYAKLFAELNVDIVIGMHSHVAGKIEYLTRKDGKKMLCAYSLGNFVSTMEYARDMVGYMLGFDLVKTDGGFETVNVRIIPTVTYFNYTSSMKLEDRENLRIYLLSDFTNELAAKHAYNHHESAMIRLDGLKKYITNTVDKEFLPDYLK